MKKTILTCLVLMAIGLSLFVSCNAEQSLPEKTDGVAYVRFGENATRDFTPSYTPVPYKDLYWFYTAEKTDGYGTYGQKTERTAVKSGTGIVLTDSEAIGPFSEGSWNFTLYAYKENNTTSTLIYKSEAIAVDLKPGETKVVSIAASVEPQGDKGTVVLSGAYFNYASTQTRDEATYPNFKMVVTETTGTDKQKSSYTYTNVTGSDKKLTLGNREDVTEGGSYSRYPVTFDSTVTLPQGTYQCNVTAWISDVNNPIGTSTFWFAVYPNATTTISGSLSEAPDTKVVFAVKERVIQTQVVVDNKATFNQKLDETETGTDEEKENRKLLTGTNVALDLSGLTSSSIQSVTLESETLVGEEAAKKFSVVDESNGAGSVLLSLDLTAKDQTGKVIGTGENGFSTSSSNKVTQTITKYIGTTANGGKCYNCGSGDGHTTETTCHLAVYYNNDKEEDIKVTSYCAQTGYVTFTTTHFSTFVLVDESNFPAYIETSGTKTYYPTLEAAFEEADKANSATTIVVNKNTYLQKDVEVSNSNITLDFKGSDESSKTVGSRNGAAIRVAENQKLAVTNSAESQAEIIRGARIDGTSNIDGNYYASFDKAYTAVAANGTVALMGDVSETSTLTLNKTFTLDLNGYTLAIDVASGSAVELPKAESSASYTVTIKDGKLSGKAAENFFTLKSYAGLVLDNVKMNVSCKRAIQIKDYSTNATVKIENSTLKVNGWYAVATNAAVATSDNSKEGVEKGDCSKDITIDIIKSTLETTQPDDDCTALLLNVPGTYTITDSVIKGGRQAAIFRGGTYTVSGSVFEYRSNNAENKSFETEAWKDGNNVPNAAIVIGNMLNSAYAYPTTVTFSETNTLTVPASGGYQLYVYQNDATEARKVTVRGNDNNWTVNSDRNGADYPTAAVRTGTDTTTTYSTLQTAINAAESGDTITLLCDTTGEGLMTGDDGNKGAITIDFGGHTYTMRNPAKGSSAEYASQAMHWGASASSIKLKNGSFKVIKNVARMAMQIYVNLEVEDMVLDFSNVGVLNYGDDGKDYGEPWQGKEVPVFSVNKAHKMTMTNCTMILPKESNAGACVDDGSELTLDCVTIDGFVSIIKGTVSTKNGTTMNGGTVKSYFSENTVESETSDDITTYTLKSN